MFSIEISWFNFLPGTCAPKILIKKQMYYYSWVLVGMGLIGMLVTTFPLGILDIKWAFWISGFGGVSLIFDSSLGTYPVGSFSLFTGASGSWDTEGMLVKSFSSLFS
jgi:hypothetical protein